MLEKIEAIENFINSVLEKIISLITKLFKLLIPSRIKHIFKKYQQLRRINAKRNKSKRAQLQKGTQKIKISLKKKFNDFLKYKHQRKFNKLYFNSKDYISSKPITQHLKDFCLMLKNFIMKKTPNLKVSKVQIISSLSLSVIVLFCGFNIYKSSEFIYKSEFPNRKPASVQEYDYRPEYKSYKERTTQVRNIKVPLLVEDVTEISSVTIDFTIRTTTRFSKIFLENYDYKLKDYFFTAVEPIISTFPLEAEGKDVLKEKITEEVNFFLEENGVEGRVDNIEIVFMIAN